MATAYDNLIEATKTLLWEKGFDATSPKAIQTLANAGQGSFYHHFKSKKELAAKAMEVVVNERIAKFEKLFGDSGPIMERIEGILQQPKDRLKGCRIGRMVWDSAISQTELQQPIERYFRHVERRILDALEQASQTGEITTTVPLEQITASIIGTIQGGLTLSRALQDPEWYEKTVRGTIALLRGTLCNTTP